MSRWKPPTPGFGLYFDPNKSTSGQRFFRDLCRVLSKEAVPLSRRPTAILFNVSASLKEIIKAKWHRQKILLRIDGMYFDRLSPRFISSFSWPIRSLLALGSRWQFARKPLAFLANLIDQNYGAFVRILLADRLIYQSHFSQQLHSRYFPEKPFDTIVNGSQFYAVDRPLRATSSRSVIRLVTTYDDWKPAKRVHDLLAFVHWARKFEGAPLELTVLGYTGKIPACAPAEMKAALETSPYVQTLPRFSTYDGAVQKALFESDLYITFTHMDPCPNAVVEAMAHGLPVIGIKSGGMPDIVGDAGILIAEEGEPDPFFTSYRYECDFRPIDFAKVLEAVKTVSSLRTAFEARVAARFSTELSIDVVAFRYAAVLRQLAEGESDDTSLAHSS